MTFETARLTGASGDNPSIEFQYNEVAVVLISRGVNNAAALYAFDYWAESPMKIFETNVNTTIETTGSTGQTITVKITNNDSTSRIALVARC